MADYSFKKPNGETIDCFGKCHEGQNFYVVCEDENHDGIFAEEVFETWPKASRWLHENYRPDIVELQAI